MGGMETAPTTITLKTRSRFTYQIVYVGPDASPGIVGRSNDLATAKRRAFNMGRNYRVGQAIDGKVTVTL